MTRDEILNMPAGYKMDLLIAETVMIWDLEFPQVELKHYKFSKDIAAAWRVVEKLELTLVPISVYETEYEWDVTRGQPIKTWWAVLHATSDPSVYLPVEQYDKEWKGWVEIIDDRITLDMVAETAPLAICRAALLAKMELEAT